jgi:hypothetical protein
MLIPPDKVPEELLDELRSTLRVIEDPEDRERYIHIYGYDVDVIISREALMEMLMLTSLHKNPRKMKVRCEGGMKGRKLVRRIDRGAKVWE